jgi:hypothetical protein
MIGTLYHGESTTLFYVVNNELPEEEQPAIIASIDAKEPDYRTLTMVECEEQLRAVEMLRWTDFCYSDVQLRELMAKRSSELETQKRRLTYGITPIIADSARLKKFEAMQPKEIIRKFPNIVAHIICESLGYATPLHAAGILKRGLIGDPDYCEWIDACWKCNPTGPVRRAIQTRHTHHGYMASFKQARMLVHNSIEHDWEPMFASWF